MWLKGESWPDEQGLTKRGDKSIDFYGEVCYNGVMLWYAEKGVIELDIGVEQGLAGSTIRLYKFAGKERPQGDVGDRIELNLIDKSNCRENFSATVTYKEELENGSFLICEVEGGDTPQKDKAEVSIYEDVPELSGVKIYKDNTIKLG